MNTYHLRSATGHHRIRADYHHIDRAAGLSSGEEVASVPWRPPVRGSHLWVDGDRPFYQGRGPGGNRRSGRARRALASCAALPPAVAIILLLACAVALALLLSGCSAAGGDAKRSRPPRDNRDVPDWAIPDLQFPDFCDGR